KEWAEDNYYHLPIERQVGDLVTANGFWADYAAFVAKGGAAFTSTRFPEASRSFAEMMLALSVLDLPFDVARPEAQFDGAKMTLRPKGPTLVFHKEIKESAPAKGAAPVLVGENYFRASDRYRWEGGERLDKFVTDEFLVATAYGCQVVVTNPTSSRRKLEVLLQIPRGAVPIQHGFFTKGLDIQLEAYSTTTFEYSFYFPAPGIFSHYPVHVAHEGEYVASAAPGTMKVVETPTVVDKGSWDYVSQNGSPDEVVQFLDANNLGRVELGRIAWRMRDRAFFERVTALLARRHVYDDTLWSYALLHDERGALREYLKHQDAIAQHVGPRIDSPIFTLDPVERHVYQHLEYSPLVNARAHPLGKRRTIVNPRLAEQWRSLLGILCCTPRLDDADCLAVTYYLLLQDRVEEALAFFARVDPAKVPTRIQYDYAQAYLDMYTPEHKLARGIAGRYASYPVDRWRKTFLDVIAKLDEAEGKTGGVADAESREQAQARLAATEAAFEFTVESKKVTVTYQNLSECRVNYYLMDVELLFSRSPFVQQKGEQFSIVKPNRSELVKFPEGRKTFSFDLPADYQSANLLVEIEAGGVRRSQPYFSHSLVAKLVESYGQLKVSRADGSPLPSAYVKVYARMRDGRVDFYKDGYTDLRGAFDYTSLNTGQIDQVERFAVMVMGEAEGVVIREAEPPRQ
ncbi:MAG TPA: hypothetical protein VHF22_12640, partial [Planctomycetota bacterium]|nr:hypothetical protein [Planctomycetota bacterium]